MLDVLQRGCWSEVERFGAGAFLKGAYPDLVRERVRRARRRHGLNGRFPDYQPAQWHGEDQLALPFEAEHSNFVEKSTCQQWFQAV